MMPDPMPDDAAKQAIDNHVALATMPEAAGLTETAKGIVQEHEAATAAAAVTATQAATAAQAPTSHAAAIAARRPPMALRPMSKGRRRFIGIYLMVLGLALLAIILWAWSLASAVVAADAGTSVQASFLGRSFTPTADFCLAMIVLLTAMIGSVVVLSLTFSSRAGHETLERGYLWWYLTRPISSAGVGLLFYLAIIAGFFDASGTSDRQALTYAAAIGGLSGLFTDQVLKKMRGILGLLPTHRSASDKNEDDPTADATDDSTIDPVNDARVDPKSG